MNAKEKEGEREERKRKRTCAHTDDRPVTKHVLSLWGKKSTSQHIHCV